MSKPKSKPKQPQEQPEQGRVHWRCSAYVEGRLRRSKADEKGDRKLFFLAIDGTTWPVLSVGRDSKSLLWVLTHIEACYNSDALWLLYPQQWGQVSGVVAVAVVDQPRPADTLQFTASVGDVSKAPADTLPLFVGRNLGKGYSFCNVSIPKNFDLPVLTKGTLIEGTARREGDRWVLAGVSLLAESGGN